MNNLNFQQSVGFPLETDILDAMQTAWTIFNALGHIAGEKSILAGCNTVDTNATDGFIFLNGEVLKFKGGFILDTIIIQEDVISLEFQDLSVHEVIKERYATFGAGDASYLWSDFKRCYPTNIIQALKDKLDTIETNAQVNVKPNWNTTNPELPSAILNRPTNLVMRAGNTYSFDFFGNPDINEHYWVINHNAGTANYVVVAEFIPHGAVSVGNIPVFAYSTWDRQLNSCRIRAVRLNAVPDCDVTVKFKIIY